MTGDWTPGGDAMWDGCRALLDDAANKFYNRYHEVLRAPEAETARPDFSATFQEVLHWSRVQGYDWCFLIDNYTTPYVSRPDPRLQDAVGMTIFDTLSHLRLSGFAVYALVVGDSTPDASDLTWIPEAWTDLTDDPDLSAAMGFTQAEVAALGQALSVDLRSALLAALPDEQRDDARLVYSSADVLSLARQLLSGHAPSMQSDISVWTMATPPPPNELSPDIIFRRNCEYLFGPDCFDRQVEENSDGVLEYYGDDTVVAEGVDPDSPVPDLSFGSSNDSSTGSPPSPPSSDISTKNFDLSTGTTPENATLPISGTFDIELKY
ncbi:hypothetical protein AURDEDRAFT_169229 [Auricularia subglabra TFB-10046 SS5]|nr:hypothetical protein AURDEDRAFT_169229 [Auricularia subglabra TFB-10046 SS5]